MHCDGMPTDLYLMASSDLICEPGRKGSSVVIDLASDADIDALVPCPSEFKQISKGF